MNPSSIQIDRNISKLRVHSIEFTDISNQELITLLEETIQNIRTISYYWVSISSEKKESHTNLKKVKNGFLVLSLLS